jgi:hypothetical protein
MGTTSPGSTTDITKLSTTSTGHMVAPAVLFHHPAASRAFAPPLLLCQSPGLLNLHVLRAVTLMPARPAKSAGDESAHAASCCIGADVLTRRNKRTALTVGAIQWTCRRRFQGQFRVLLRETECCISIVVDWDILSAALEGLPLAQSAFKCDCRQS